MIIVIIKLGSHAHAHGYAGIITTTMGRHKEKIILAFAIVFLLAALLSSLCIFMIIAKPHHKSKIK
jgi:hypothetical protein